MMFSANASDGLKNDHHVVTVTNRGATFLDIDFVRYISAWRLSKRPDCE